MKSSRIHIICKELKKKNINKNIRQEKGGVYGEIEKFFDNYSNSIQNRHHHILDPGRRISVMKKSIGIKTTN